MAVFDHPAFDGHQAVHHFSDRATGLRAIIAIHDTRLGPALGGCRIWPYGSADAAVADVLRLSRAMTYKSALAKLDLGGGKAVVIGDPATVKTQDALMALGRAVDSLGGRYILAEDVGTAVEDMDVVATVTPHVAGLRQRSGDPSPATAHGVFRAIETALTLRAGASGLDGVTVAIQGLGNVGLNLGQRLAAAGARLIIADIAEGRVAAALDRFDAEARPAATIHAAEADVFAPCALGGVLNERTIPEITAPVVAGAANNQLAAPPHARLLRDRGILYAPDYAINAGGIINIAHELLGYDRRRAYAQIDSIAETLRAIIERADAEGMSTAEAADRMAEDRLNDLVAQQSAA